MASLLGSRDEGRSKSDHGKYNGDRSMEGANENGGAKTSDGEGCAETEGVKNPGTDETSRSYRKDCSVFINVGDNKLVKAIEVIQEVTKICGEGQLFACVPKAGNMYVVTLKDKMDAELVSSGIKCGEKFFPCSLVKKDSVVVSILNVDPYVPDEEIKEKLNDMDVEMVSDIRRIHYPETEVENGNRVCRVKLPKTLRSLPYLMKLSDGDTTNSYRVIHNNQEKLCFKCNKPDHVIRDCPEFVCFRCNQQGHFRRQCQAQWCRHCHSYVCECYTEDTDVENNIQEQESELESEKMESENENNNVYCERCDMDGNDCLCKCPHCGDVYIDCDCLINYSASDMSQGTDEEHTDSDNNIQVGEETTFGDFIEIKEQELKAEIDRKRHRGNEQAETGSKKRIVQKKKKENRR